jgi:hypothetical protein
MTEHKRKICMVQSILVRGAGREQNVIGDRLDIFPARMLTPPGGIHPLYLSVAGRHLYFGNCGRLYGLYVQRRGRHRHHPSTNKQMQLTPRNTPKYNKSPTQQQEARRNVRTSVLNRTMTYMRTNTHSQRLGQRTSIGKSAKTEVNNFVVHFEPCRKMSCCQQQQQTFLSQTTKVSPTAQTERAVAGQAF